RHVYYGGQLTGSADYGAFYLNGPHSPLGSRTKSPIVWDESHRAIYQPSTAPGTFVRPKLKPPANTAPVCQPYLVFFRDRFGLKGKAIPTDDLYFRLGDYGYPLPTNTIKKMGFCTMTPAEVRIALELLEKSPIEGEVTGSNEKIELTGDPVPFSPKYV